MLKLGFKECCMECGNIDVDYDYAESCVGDKTVYIYCQHAKVCKKYIEENSKTTDEVK